jgi:hypothetical protein
MPTALENLSDPLLLQKTQALVKLERETTTEILRYLREIERRKLYSAQGCPSLFDFCTCVLGYNSEGSAQRRIASLRLLKELPEIESQIQSGTLTLSVVSQAQSFFRAEAKAAHCLSADAKREVLHALQGKSSREAEKELLRRSSQTVPFSPERVRVVSETHSELKLVLSNETLRDLEKLKGLLAHSHPDMTTGELIAFLAAQSLERLERSREPKRKAKQETAAPQTERIDGLPPTPAAPPHHPSSTSGSLPTPPSPSSPPPTQKPTEPLRRIPSSLRRAVFLRDQNRCVSCHSTRALEIDHVVAFAHGGRATLANLRVLCRHCNRRHAIESFGLRKIERASHAIWPSIHAPEFP